MRCSYCIAAGLPQTSMDIEMGRQIIDHFVYLSEGGKTIEFGFSGGEPLAAFGVLGSLTQYAGEHSKAFGMEPRFVLKTNGTILNPEIISYLQAYSVNVAVSIDGTPDAHDRNRKTLGGGETSATIERNVRTLIAESIPCSASLTVHPDSVHDVVRNVRHLRELGLTRIDVAPAYGTVVWTDQQSDLMVRSLGEIADFVHQVNNGATHLVVGPLYPDSEHVGDVLSESWGCHAGTTHLAYLPNGDIAGCSALAMLAHRFPELRLGNVFDGISTNAIDRLVNVAQAPQKCRPSCIGCFAANNCTGGCLAINYATTGMPLAPPKVYCETISAIPSAWCTAWAAA